MVALKSVSLARQPHLSELPSLCVSHADDPGKRFLSKEMRRVEVGHRPSGGDAWPTAPLVEGLPPLCLSGPFSSPLCSKARCTIGSIFVMAWLVLDTHTGTPRPLIRPMSGTEATRGPPPSPTFHHISFPDCLPCGLSSSHRCEDRASRSCSSGSQKCPRPVLPAELSSIHLSVTYLSIIYLSIYHLFIYSVQFGLLVMSDSFATPWAVTHQAPLSMEFSRQEHWSG